MWNNACVASVVFVTPEGSLGREEGATYWEMNSIYKNPASLKIRWFLKNVNLLLGC